MESTEFQTQFLLRCTKASEPPAAFFKRVQKCIWDSFPRALVESRDNGHGELSGLPFDVFIAKHSIEAGPCLEVRNLQTKERLLHASTTTEYLPCPSLPLFKASDHSRHTEVCLDMNLPNPLVRVSIKVWIAYQPYAGFFPLEPLRPDVPVCLKNILALPDAIASFFPRVDLHNASPGLKYPMKVDPICVDEKNDQEFLSRVSDPTRPIPFVVFFGNSQKLHHEASFLVSKIYPKSWVYILKNTDCLREGLPQVIPGINVGSDFTRKVCRIFFPFGNQYRNDNFANPSYDVPFWKSSVARFRNQILTGILRYFELDYSSSWCTSRRDVHMEQLELAHLRNSTRMQQELEGSSDAVKKMQSIVNGTLDRWRKDKQRFAENEAVFEDERKLFTEENHKLSESLANKDRRIGELESKCSSLEHQLKSWQQSSAKENTGISFSGIAEYYHGEIREHVIRFIQAAKASIVSDDFQRRLQIYDAVLKANPSSGAIETQLAEVDRIIDLNKEGGLTGVQKSEFEKLGFSCEHAGKHDKVSRGGLFTTFSCTPSDYRTSSNKKAEFKKKFF